MCWRTPLRPAWLFPTRLRVLLLGRAFAAFGSKADASPGSQNHPNTLFQLLSALHDLVSRLLSWFFAVCVCKLSLSRSLNIFPVIPTYFPWSEQHDQTRVELPEGSFFHENNNYSKGFGPLKFVCIPNYRNRRSVLQQLPHFEVIRAGPSPPPPPPPHLSLPDVDAVAVCAHGGLIWKAIVLMVDCQFQIDWLH